MGNRIRYIKSHKNQTEYEEFLNSDNFIIPNISLIDSNGKIIINNDKLSYYSKKYFTIENIGDYELTLYILLESCSISAYGNLYYCFRNSDNWQELGENEITIPTNESVKFKGVLNKGEVIGKFAIEGDSTCKIYGNAMSLVFGDDFFGKTDLSEYDFIFENLLQNCTHLVDASDLILPATTLAGYCYSCMFYDCSNLTTAPQLPATTLAYDCYYDMFGGCTSLTEAPQLPATTLAYGCYKYMFSSCTSLTTAPELPATTLADECYSSMFYDCSNLTTAPQLPATTLASGCYSNMFYGCINLTTAPELLATTLTDYCYNNMFDDCSNLSKITMLATYIRASYCLTNWVDGVSSSGTFIKHPSMTSLPNGKNGIPNGWSVEDYNE